MMAKFFISDTHFFHNNILRFDNRPWSNIRDMHEDMLYAWNKKVKENDEVYILGDFSWRIDKESVEFLKKLKGRKHLIVGNHDRTRNGIFSALFETIKDYETIKVTLQNGNVKMCVLSHHFIPFYDGHFRNAIMLYGHVHITKEYDLVKHIIKWLNDNGSPIEAYNVGCMLPYMNYEPRTLDEILKEAQV